MLFAVCRAVVIRVRFMCLALDWTRTFVAYWMRTKKNKIRKCLDLNRVFSFPALGHFFIYI